MKQARLRLELIDNVVQSKRSATVGQHESLEVITGSSLLGWAASRIYSKLSIEDAFRVFHSGKVRFGVGLPMADNGELALPMPLCWHEDKVDGSAYENGVIDPAKVYNAFYPKPQDFTQPRQLRQGFITKSGAVVFPDKSHNPHIAIKEQGIDNVLYGYESLSSAQCYHATITADEDISMSLFENVVQQFQGAILRIGRSKYTEYGRVKADVLGEITKKIIFKDIIDAKVLTIWLLSDLVLRDTNGFPALLPHDPTWLGLPPGKVINAFVRYRSYAPYNIYRKSRDIERQVLMAGSVIKIEFEEPISLHHIRILAEGIGSYRESGLGAIEVNSMLLEKVNPCFESEVGKTLNHSVNIEGITRSDSLFVPFLKKRAERIFLQQDSKKWAEEKLKVLQELYQSARNYYGVKDSEPFGPGRSQWRRVFETTMMSNNQDVIIEKLFNDVNGVCKSGDDEWNIESSKGNTLRGWLKELVNEIKNKSDLNLRLQWLTRLAETLRENPKIK